MSHYEARDALERLLKRAYDEHRRHRLVNPHHKGECSAETPSAWRLANLLLDVAYIDYQDAEIVKNKLT